MILCSSLTQDEVGQKVFKLGNKEEFFFAVTLGKIRKINKYDNINIILIN